MKNFLYIITFFLLTIVTPITHAQNHTHETEPQFFSVLHDVPLMEGLIEIEDNTTAYDKPNGRIIDAFAKTNAINKENIIAYYNATLPQFGWGKTAQGQFYRKDEILKLTFEQRENTQILKISIRPSL